MGNTVFDYQDFYQFLPNEIEKIARNKRGEKSRLAEYLNVMPSLLSQYLSGSRVLSEDQVFLISEFLGHSELEREYVSLLFRYSMASNKKLKMNLKEKMDQIKKNSLNISKRVIVDKELSESEKANLYSSWYYIAIWAYTSLEGGKSLDEISTRFDLPIKTVREALDFLVKTQLCKIENGKYKHHLNRTHIEKNSSYFKQHHNNWRIKSIQKIDESELEDINFTAPLTLSKKDFEKLREEILKMIQSVYKTVKETNPEEMYCLNIDFFRL
ncbi:MAG: TIGR02147 family protein [Bacteriovoracaceae bacterium]